MTVHSHPVFALTPGNEPLRVCLYVQRVGEVRAAMLAADGVPLPQPGTSKGVAFLRMTPEEAEREAKAYAGPSESVNLVRHGEEGLPGVTNR